MKLYLVIDIGTSSMRGILYSEKSDEIEKITIELSPLYQGDLVEQEVVNWDQGLDKILKFTSSYMKKSSGQLSGVFLTSQRSSLICLDKYGQALIPAIMWQDKRTNSIVEEFSKYEDLFIAKTGAKLNPVYLGPKIYFVKKHFPEIYEKTCKFVSIADYVRYKLTGNFITDYSYASRTSLFNLQRKKWDKTLLNIFNIDESKLCKLEEVGTKGHYISSKVLVSYDIKGDIPFISSGGDQQCSAVGMGVINEGSLSLTLGSGGFLLAPTEKISNDSKVILNYHSINNQFLAEGLLLSVASLLNYFHRTFFNDLDNSSYYDLISTILENGMETNILHFPHYQGRGTPDWNNDAKGAYFNLTFGVSKEEMLLSAIESIGIEIINNIRTFEDVLETEINQIFVAGGISNNKQIIQLLSNMTGIDFIKPFYAETTALGALIIGLNSLEEEFKIQIFLDSLSRKYPATIFKSDKEKYKYYTHKINEWNKLYDKIYAN